MWDLHEALKLIRPLQSKLRDIGFHVTLGGGILNLGKSGNDLDLYIIPLEDESEHPDDKQPVWSKNFYNTLMNLLEKEFGLVHYNEDYGNNRSSYRQKVFYMMGTKKIDVFII